MRPATREEAISGIKQMLRTRLRKKGYNDKQLRTPEWREKLALKAEEIYLSSKAVGDEIQVLEPSETQKAD